jgi:hypothetical protein
MPLHLLLKDSAGRQQPAAEESRQDSLTFPVDIRQLPEAAEPRAVLQVSRLHPAAVDSRQVSRVFWQLPAAGDSRQASQEFLKLSEAAESRQDSRDEDRTSWDFKGIKPAHRMEGGRLLGLFWGGWDDVDN